MLWYNSSKARGTLANGGSSKPIFLICVNFMPWAKALLGKPKTAHAMSRWPPRVGKNQKNLFVTPATVWFYLTKPPMSHVVMTGRNAKPELIEVADLVTEMTMIKHPFRSGIKAQPGVEF